MVAKSAFGGMAIYLLGLCLMLHLDPAWAKADGWCTTTMPGALPSTVQQSAIVVPRDLPVGSVIPGTHFDIALVMMCNAGAFDAGINVINAAFFSTVSFTQVANLTNVYTFHGGIAGVGIRFINESGQPVPIGRVTTSSCTHQNAVLIAAGNSSTTRFAFNGAFELVKISDQISPGSQGVTFYPGVCGQAWGNDTEVKSAWRINTTIASATAVTCTVSNKNMVVEVPPITMANLEDAEFAGRPTLFNIELRCASGANLYITMIDNGDTANRGDKLTPAAGSAARGVAFQISREDGTIVSYGADSSAAGNANQFKVGATIDGVVKIPLKVSYVRSGTGLSAGALLGRATFTLSYQ